MLTDPVAVGALSPRLHQNLGMGFGIGEVLEGLPDLGQADPPGIPVPPIPPIPGPAMPGVPNIPMPNIPDDLIPWNGANINPVWLPGMPPGQNPFGPPGQVMKMATLPLPGGGIIANPFYGVPPGQWGTVPFNPVDLEVTLPTGDLVDLVFDTTENAWGYFVNGEFFRFPVQFAPPPAPPAG